MCSIQAIYQILADIIKSSDDLEFENGRVRWNSIHVRLNPQTLDKCFCKPDPNVALRWLMIDNFLFCFNSTVSVWKLRDQVDSMGQIHSFFRLRDKMGYCKALPMEWSDGMGSLGIHWQREHDNKYALQFPWERLKDGPAWEKPVSHRTNFLPWNHGMTQQELSEQYATAGGIICHIMRDGLL